MTDHVVSPVVLGGQLSSSLLASLPLPKTRTQVLTVGITWVSPYVFRPSTHGLEQQTCLRGTTGTKPANNRTVYMGFIQE